MLSRMLGRPCRLRRRRMGLRMMVLLLLLRSWRMLDEGGHGVMVSVFNITFTTFQLLVQLRLRWTLAGTNARRIHQLEHPQVDRAVDLVSTRLLFFSLSRIHLFSLRFGGSSVRVLAMRERKSSRVQNVDFDASLAFEMRRAPADHQSVLLFSSTAASFSTSPPSSPRSAFATLLFLFPLL
ncbi:hypothetical protein BDY24DRAFT_120651 [Mrakia frigida]|uniref:uncharacterized protein n=1 Tax=Mrakia frigida TaxID=29902 RepID=UPI003FCBFA71